jgi:ABC-type multidrug transport system fused ATPase/permease subunit
MMAIGLLGSAGLLLIIPLLSITGILDLGSTEIFFLSWLINYFQGIPKTQSLLLILTIYVSIVIGQSWFSRQQTILNKKIQQGFVRHLREETYKHLLQANWEFFLRNRKTDIVKIMTSEIKRVKKGTYLFLQFISSLVFAGIQIVIAFCLSPKMTFFTLFCGLTLLFLSCYFIRKSRQFGEENLKLSKLYLAGITDHLNGIKDIKSNTLEVSYLGWVRSLCQKVEHNSVEFIKLKTGSQFIYSAVSAVLVAAFIFFLISSFESQPAQLILIVVIFSRLWPIVSRIQSNLETLVSLVPAFEALVGLQEQCIKLQELKDEHFENVKPINLKEGIECQQVYFRYDQKKDSYTLKNIQLHIPANRMTAIVGPSGAGKSTLVDLLMGLNQAERGMVLLDGVPLANDNLVSLRRSISYVPQDPFLFNASIRENLLLIEPKATEEQLWEALEFSSALEFVKKLSEGLDTHIGDRGIRLSGGERQRLVLARAILRKPSILILDEATSALDTETEAKVKEAIDRLKGKMTIIAIAHRLSTIRHADQVIVLEKGEIIQRGGFAELAIEKRGMFSNLLGKQVGVLS